MRLVATWKDTPGISCCNLHQRRYGEITAVTIRVLAQDVVANGEPEIIMLFCSEPTIPTIPPGGSRWVQ